MYNYYPLSHSSKINLYPIEMSAIDRIVVEEENMGPVSKEILKNSMDNWRKALKGNMSLVLKLAGLEEDSHQIVFNNNGLMNEFAGLKTIKDIEAFSKKYGLLGIQHPESEQVNSRFPEVKATLQPSFIFRNYGFSVLEPIELWQWHINEVQKILRLYQAVRKASSDELIDEVIEIKMRRGMFGSLAEDREIMDRYFIYWTNGEEILMIPEDFEEKPILEIAQYTLAKILESHISGGVNLGVGDFISKPSTKGFMITEERYTRYLLTAIYYDLWQTINESKHVYICENKNCRSLFVKSGRKKYCNEACKQEAYRIRLEEKKGKDNL
ncbi:hypothetical protein COC61_11040 [Priestia megaterium]|uniref:hypothetical protein n=1 Tax=Priestia megaterium TaxID=1404 RepID=UPI000BFB5F58|nr:hypothetical protein [Priestia megaterium]PGR96905.1 hypothetical protein COC61_11040 [Priestia megaterium]